jgi:chromate reductase
MTRPVTVLGFAGSLRKGSYNRLLLRNAAQMTPEDARMEIFDLDGIPGYNQDLESNRPPKVTEFKDKIRSSDALLIVTPEYNYSIPGVLKNAIDWASRPPQDNVFKGKPVAMMSASTGMLGGARAQYHLRQAFVFLEMYPINKPETFITFADKKFDANGKRNDEKTLELMSTQLRTLVTWVKRLQPAAVR